MMRMTVVMIIELEQFLLTLHPLRVPIWAADKDQLHRRHIIALITFYFHLLKTNFQLSSFEFVSTFAVCGFAVCSLQELQIVIKKWGFGSLWPPSHCIFPLHFAQIRSSSPLLPSDGKEFYIPTTF